MSFCKCLPIKIKNLGILDKIVPMDKPNIQQKQNMFCSDECQLCQKLSGGNASSLGQLEAICQQLHVEPALTELAISHVIGSLQESPRNIAKFLSLTPTFCLEAFILSKICRAWKTVRVIQYLQDEFMEMHHHKLNAEASSVFFVMYMFDNSFLNLRLNSNIWSILNDNFEFDTVLTQETHFKRAAMIIKSCPNKEQQKHFAEVILNQQIWVLPPAFVDPVKKETLENLPHTRNRKRHLSEKSWKLQLQTISTLKLPVFFSCNVTNVFIEFMTTEQVQFLWQVNFERIHAFNQRKKYCEDCEFQKKCTMHSKTLYLFQVPSEYWKETMFPDNQIWSYIVVDGLSPLHSLLFVRKMVGKEQEMKMNWPTNIKANSRYVGCWALTMEILNQQKMLRSTLKDVLSQEPVECSKSSTYYKTVEEFEEVEIENLKTSWRTVHKMAFENLRRLVQEDLGSEVKKVLFSMYTFYREDSSKAVRVGNHEFFLSWSPRGYVCSMKP